MTKPGLPQGMRDFAAETVRKRNYIFQTIRDVFELYGFEPLETPAMENLDTLLGKYGEEGDKLIFKVLNNGLSDPKNIDKASAGFEKILQGRTTADITERALKYDLTIPFARYVAMNHGQLVFPYKRYQMQPVWRADRPQKGRYREFTQCDADIVGSRSLLNEADLCGIYHDVFTKLGLPGYSLQVNNRKVLAGLSELCGAALTVITTAIDKIDKAGLEKVLEELRSNGLTGEQVRLVEKYLDIKGSNENILNSLSALFPGESGAHEGIAELQFIIKSTQGININIDPSLARGLNYYTGFIFEVKARDVKIGSIGGGGRYDDLTGLFGVKGIPGVGISFGVDRIYDVLEELKLFPAVLQTGTKVLLLNMGENEVESAHKILKQLRSAGISSELYPDPAKMDKQLKYADKKKINFAVIIGSKEIQNGEAVVKDLFTGKQDTIPFQNLITFINQK